MLILFVVVLYGPILLITILVSWEREDNMRVVSVYLE